MTSVPARLLLAVVLMFATVPMARAEEVDFWNFRGSMPKEARMSGLTTAEVTDEGLFVRTGTEGFISWPGQPLDGPADAITLRVRSVRPVTAHFVWQPTDGSGETGLYQIPIAIPYTETARDVDVVLSTHSEWDWRTDLMGIVFPPGTELILEEMNVRHWTPMEKLIEGWKSFWTFDDFKPHSINFLWGPLIATNGPARAELYATLPPRSWSATRIFLGILFAAGTAGMFLAVVRRNRDLGLGIFAATFCALWLLFDLRMGAEIVSYAADDLRTYVFADEDERSLRSHGVIYTLFNQVLPEIKKHERYALFSPPGSVVYPNLRYLSYPSVAVLPGQDMTGLTLYVVFGDTGIALDDQSRLTRRAASGTGTEILSPPGAITKRVHESIYLFEPNR